MIVKVRQAAPENSAVEGWVWVDGLESVRHHGVLTDEQGAWLCTDDLAVVAEALERTWGKERTFTREVWPERLDQAAYVHVVVGRKANDDAVLFLIADEAFVMSDAGKTIDHLR